MAAPFQDPHSALVNRILAPSFVDGPGSRMAIFLQGCDLRCLYCHNPETLQACDGCGVCVPLCPHGALTRVDGAVHCAEDRCRHCDTCLRACPSSASPRCQPMGVEPLLARIRPWAPYLDGITFSGGECTLHWPFLLQAIPRIQAATGLTVLLDSNGAAPDAVFAALLAVADGWLIDLKAGSPDTHQALTGAASDQILRNLRRAAAAGKLTEVRTVLVPGHNDDPKSIMAMAIQIRDLGPAIPWRLTPFRPQGVRGLLADQPPLTPEAFQSLRRPLAGLVNLLP